MFDTHVYEVLPGELFFRRSGNDSRTFMKCKVVRTRGNAFPHEDGWIVGVSMLVTGSDDLLFREWFSDWDTARDNIGSNMQGGRPLEVAIEATILDRIIATGTHVSQHLIHLEDERYRPFGSPLVAIRIGERWIEPDPPRRRSIVLRDGKSLGYNAQ